MASTAGTEGPEWSARAEGWAEQWGAFAAPAREALADATGIGPGTRVLDVGCGSGELCALAAARGAEVGGHRRRRGHDRDRPPAAARTPTCASGRWSSCRGRTARFDVATAVNALQFAADYVDALAEAARVVAPRRLGRRLQLGRGWSTASCSR